MDSIHQLSDAELGEVLAHAAYGESYYEAGCPADSFLSSGLSALSPAEAIQAAQQMKILLRQSLDEAKRRPLENKNEIARAAMNWASELVEYEHEGHNLSRCFDFFDELLGIHYASDALMNEANTERLYNGAAAGVQTPYSTLIQYLDVLQPPSGAHVVDLGAGYGRLGFVIGLLRPDLYFTGIEYVGARVAVAQQCVDKLQLGEHVRFIEQDLKDSQFEIPAADLYYLYDPFTEETYRIVAAQLKKLSRETAFMLFCKGHAGEWIETLMDESPVHVFENGNLKLFQISPVPLPHDQLSP